MPMPAASTDTVRRRLRACAALLGLVALGACGGGGGGASNAAAPAANQAPQAAFSLSVTDGLAPLAVDFDASASRDGDGRVTDYSWDFGDDASATGPTPSHTFADTGSFTVTLTVTDDDGSSDTTSRTVRVRGATVSGTITIGARSSVDSDVNDRFTTPVSNNEFGRAQAVGNPLRLGGFVNLPGTGSETGNFHAEGDQDDYFFVQLEGDERIVLSIGDPSADLNLELYDDASMPNLVDASISLDPTEDLPAPSLPGGYFVRVFAVSGASNYVLSISDDPTLALGARRLKRLSDPFVPGEVLLARTPRSEIGLYRLERGAAGHYRLGSAPGSHADPRATAAPLPDLRLPDPAAPATAAMAPGQTDRYRTLLALRELRRRDDLALVEANGIHRPLRTPDDAFYDQQWHYPAIALEDAWELTTGAEPGNPEVVVAVVDTGVLLDHPDLQSRLLRDGGGRVVGYDFIQDPERANDGDGIDPDPDDPGDDARGPGQGSYHGTHVAGTVAADSDNGIGVAGVSWGARLMPLRALGIDGGTTFDVLQAVRYAAGLSNTSGTTPPVTADIVNLSLGSDFFSEAEQRTIDEVRRQGVFLVASAGNDASDVPTYPASYDGVLSVSATTISGASAGYSSFGPYVDLAAPGGDGTRGVLSTLGERNGDEVNFGVGFLAGTSMAAPHVAGVIALMKAVYPALGPAEFDALLQDGQLTDDAGAPGRDDHFGWGVINAYAAVQAALLGQTGEQGTFISVSSGRLDFQAFDQVLSFEVAKVGDAPVTVVLTDDEEWLTVLAEPGQVDAEGFGAYQARVARTGLADGTYTATISISSSNPDVGGRSIEVVMRVTSPDPDADAGQHYVLLVDATSNDSVAVQTVTAGNGEYRFELADVAPGDYQLFAGTDLDDDDFICDGGEACGAFPNLSSPATLSIDARQQPTLSDRSFSSEFRTTATTNVLGENSLGENSLGENSPGDVPGGLPLTRPSTDP